MAKERKMLKRIKCECGYHNLDEFVARYGTCNGCGKVLDEKAKFRHDMIVKMHLWRGKRGGRI